MEKRVECIAMFKDGKVEPLKIRISQDDGENQIIKISKILERTFERDSLTSKRAEFKCRSQIGNMCHDFQLKYSSIDNIWMMGM